MRHLLKVHQDRGSNLDFLLEFDRTHMTPLQYCIKHDARSSVRQLLEIGKRNPGQASGKEGRNAHVEFVKNMCAVPSTSGGHQALHTAAQEGNLQMVKLLLGLGAPANAHTKIDCAYGRTPIDVAFGAWQYFFDVENERSQIFEDIIADIFRHRRSEISGRALKLNCAAERGSTKVFQLFEKRHSEKDEYGWTPTMVASQHRFNVAHNKHPAQSSDSGTRPPTRWSSTDKDERLTVSDDGLLVSFTSRGEVPSSYPTYMYMRATKCALILFSFFIRLIADNSNVNTGRQPSSAGTEEFLLRGDNSEKQDKQPVRQSFNFQPGNIFLLMVT